MAQINPMMIAPSKLSSTRSNRFFKEVYHYVVGHWSLNVLVNRMKCVLDVFFPQCEQSELPSLFSGALRMSFFCSTDITLSSSLTVFLPEFITVSLDLISVPYSRQIITNRFYGDKCWIIGFLSCSGILFRWSAVGVIFHLLAGCWRSDQ